MTIKVWWTQFNKFNNAYLHFTNTVTIKLNLKEEKCEESGEEVPFSTEYDATCKF